MIQRIDFPSDLIIGMHVTGDVTEADIQPWAAMLDQKTDQPRKLRVYIEYENVNMVTLRAAIADLKFDLSHLNDFEKAALVSDKSWTNLPAAVANFLPSLEAKQFTTAEKEQARQWIQS